MQQNLSQFAPVLVLVAILIGYLFHSKRQGVKQREADLTELCHYFEHVNSTRAFPTVDLNTVTAKKGEFGLINEGAQLYEMRAHRESVGMSFRVAKGVYVGKRAYISKDHLDRTAAGSIILMNQRLLFINAAKTMAIQIGDIISAQAGRDCLQVHSEKRQRQVIFEFRSAQLAALLIAAFLRHPFTENALPKGMTITATPMANHDGITLSFRDPTELQPVARS